MHGGRAGYILDLVVMCAPASLASKTSCTPASSLVSRFSPISFSCMPFARTTSWTVASFLLQLRQCMSRFFIVKFDHPQILIVENQASSIASGSSPAGKQVGRWIHENAVVIGVLSKEIGHFIGSNGIVCAGPQRIGKCVTRRVVVPVL